VNVEPVELAQPAQPPLCGGHVDQDHDPLQRGIDSRDLKLDRALTRHQREAFSPRERCGGERHDGRIRPEKVEAAGAQRVDAEEPHRTLGACHAGLEL
jgi:hypothetical protein